MKTIVFDHTPIAYAEKGDPSGIPLVLLHGFCEDSSIWEGLQEEITGCRMIVVDLPGFGSSGWKENYDIEWAADSVCSVLDHMGIAQSVIVGHSMGGYVALALAERAPGRLLGLCLFHSHPFADSEEKQSDRLRSIRFVQQNGPEPFIKQLIPRLFAPLFASSNVYLLNRLIFLASRNGAAPITSALQAMASRPDRSAVLAGIAVPVLFLIGALDTTIPTAASWKQTILPDRAIIHLFAKEAHMGMFQYREAAGRIIQSFATSCTS